MLLVSASHDISSVAHDMDASTSTSAGTKCDKFCLNNHLLHDKCNGVVTVVQSTVPRYIGEFEQPLMLGLVSWGLPGGIHAGGYLSTKETERSHF